MARFAVATFALVLLLLAACLAGGAWAYAALAYVTVFAAVMDAIPVGVSGPRGDAAADRFARTLTVALAGAHFVLLPLGVGAVAGRVPFDPPQAGALALALGLFAGQVGHPVAHELIHAGARWRRRLGAAIYVSVLFGHHASAHLRVHHVHVATPRDPNTARAGEGFYRFWLRAWGGSFMAGLRAESQALARAGRPSWRHPYVAYGCGAALAVCVAAVLAGGRGVAAFAAIAILAQAQILLSDYVQHFGLARRTGADGAPEPVGSWHSWNAPHWFSSSLMLNATRHSDHHVHPGRPFPALCLTLGDMPILPRPLPVMATLALYPPAWRRVMGPRARSWRERANRPAGHQAARLRGGSGR